MLNPAIRTAIVLLASAAAAGAQVPAGGEFRVNSFTTNRQERALSAMEPDGDFVVVWTSFSQGGSYDQVFAKRFASSGAERGSEFRVSAYTTTSHRPALALGSKGDLIVAWGSNQDGSGLSLHGRRFDADGNPAGPDFRVNTFTPGNQYQARVGRAADGRFVVIWRIDDDGSSTGIVARRFDASGNAVGSEFAVNTYTLGMQQFADVAVETDGDFVVVWMEVFNDRDGSQTSIFGQRFDAAGNRLGSDFQVNTYTTGFQSDPSVSMSPAGGFVASWSGPGDGSAAGVFARRFDASGNPIGNDFVVNTYTTGGQYGGGGFGRVAHDARGNFVVTWQGPGDFTGSDSFAQRFTAAGVRRGTEFRVNTYTTNPQVMPSVASDSVGNFVIDWDSELGQDGSETGVYAQRFGGLVPFALAVDSSPGNQVLEPGETVAVRPTWRNFNGAAQTFSGTLTDISGPAGATYAITDAAGDYGAVADGATAQCTDCYAVSVSSPPARPALHWDASAVESILPDTQGQQKQWRLHVGDSFSDVPQANPFYRFVETLLHHGITGGCTADAYCPLSATTREQMAVFVLVAKEGLGYVPPACGATPVFADVPASSPFCRWIEELARRGVVSGCGGGNYCPTSSVTREQMAVFVLRTVDPALSPAACGTPVFADVPATSPFCRWIEELARRGVVTGCGGGNYCPTAAVTREQMGVFISVTFGLALYGP